MCDYLELFKNKKTYGLVKDIYGKNKSRTLLQEFN